MAKAKKTADVEPQKPVLTEAQSRVFLLVKGQQLVELAKSLGDSPQKVRSICLKLQILGLINLSRQAPKVTNVVLTKAGEEMKASMLPANPVTLKPVPKQDTSIQEVRKLMLQLESYGFNVTLTVRA